MIRSLRTLPGATLGRINAWVSPYVPEHIDAAGHGAAARVMLAAMFGGSTIGIVSQVVGYLLTGEAPFAFVAPLMLLQGVVFVVYLRRGGTFPPVVHLGNLLYLGMLTQMVAATGGLNSPVMVQMLCVPAAGAAFLGRRAGLVWGAITSLAVVLVDKAPWVLVELLGVQEHPDIPPLFLTLHGLFQLSIMVFYLDFTREKEALALQDNVAALRSTNGALESTNVALERANHSLVLTRLEADKARRAAESASRARTAFLATMSHEIRTPLNGALGTLQLLESTPLSEDQTELVGVAQRSGRSLLALINDILDLTKFESGDVPMEDVPVSLRELLSDVSASVGDRARASDTTLSMQLQDGLPRALLGDPTRLRQILVNLVGNAVKFAPGGRVVLRVAQAGGMLKLTVLDDGIGMSADVVERLFQPFMQADSSMTRRFGGTGLGLAITHRLVDAMGGRIAVSSRPGEGSCFEVQVPLRVATLSDVASVAPDGTIDTTLLEDVLVLLVEDNPVNVLVAKRMLTQLGCRVEVAVNGQQALDKVPLVGPDVVLMDVQMPVMDGLSATRALRQREHKTRHLPIIGLSADAMQEEQAKGLAAGMDAYVTKPIVQQELVRALVTAVCQPARV